MKTLVCLLGLFSLLLVGINGFAQDVLDGIYVKEHVPARKPTPYYHLREADVMWSKKIWRMIDLREKINHPLYFPKKPLDDRMSLIDLLIFGMEKANMIVYDAVDDEFKIPLTSEGLIMAFDAQDKVSMVEDVNTGQIVEQQIKGEKKTDDVKRYMIKEVWFFDKQKSWLDVRIVGMCPIRTFFKDGDVDQLEPIFKQVFWVYFPASRPILANHEVFNVSNDAERRTFDDIFYKRMFNSYIYQETNVYDNRRIADYTLGLDAIMESDKVKEKIFLLEHDVWEY
jgi:gliding motility associated protien GldN